MNNKRTKVLIISPAAPFPLRSGADLAQHFFLEELPNYIDIVFCTKINDNVHFKKLMNYKEKNKKIDIVYFDNRVSGYHKFILNIKIFIAKVLKKVKGKEVEINERNYRPYSDIVDWAYLNFIQTVIKKEKIDVVQFEFLNDANIAKFLSSDLKKVLIHHEIWFKAVEMRNNMTELYSRNELDQLKTDEFNLIENFDTTVVFNNEDKMLLEGNFINKSVLLSPYGIPKEEISKKDTSDHFENFLFIGGEVHFANKQGLKWFLDDIYIPNIEVIEQDLIIIGKWSKGFISKYNFHSKIKFKNSVDNLGPFYENAVMVVPILSGSGLRTKILIALANNLPVLTTRFAAEGLYNATEINHLLLFEDSADFLQIIKGQSLHSHIKATAQAGFKFYSNYFSKEKLISNRLKIYSLS